MKLDPNKEHYDQEFGWVAHEDGLSTYKSSEPINLVEQVLVARRYELEILGGVTDETASYSYDDWALCELDGEYYLFSTSGCSCPSPNETWRVEIGPATLQEIRNHVISGHYDGHTLPKKQESDFIKLIDEAIADAN